MELKLDEQKLIYHPKLVDKWLSGKKIAPIYSEISLTSACNNRCIYCAPNFFLNYKAEYLDTETLKATLTNMADIGVKAIMFGGEGEPLLHKDIDELVEHSKMAGLDVAITTNGTLYNEDLARRTLPHLSWIKFSIDSGNSEIYAKLHGTNRANLKKVLDNIIAASSLKRKCGYDCTIGGQSILLKDNLNSIIPLAKFLKTVKVDYMVIKPFSDHYKRLGDKLDLPTNDDINKLRKDLIGFEDKNFKVILRDRAFENLNKPRGYYKCYAQDFMAYIDTLGGVHSCINYIDDDDYTYGNIYEDTFENIWKHKHEIRPNLNNCRSICRVDLINKYLWNLKNPDKHVNFI